MGVRKLISLGIMLSIILLFGCSNEQIKDAINECKNDPNCKVIIDEEIDEVLKERGIVGGKITVSELEDIESLVDSYVWPYTYSNYINFHNLGLYQDNETEKLYSELGEYFIAQEALSKFKINELLKDEKQYMLIDNTKHLIYSTGKDMYTYEILTADDALTYNIDLTFNSIRELRLTKNSNSILSEISDGTYNNDKINLIYNDGDLIFKWTKPSYVTLNIISPNHQYIRITNKVLLESELKQVLTVKGDDNGILFQIEIKPYTGSLKDYANWLRIEENIISDNSTEDISLSLLINYIEKAYDNDNREYDPSSSGSVDTGSGATTEN